MSLFSVSSNKTAKPEKYRRRSSSEVRKPRTSDRNPIVDFTENSDVATAVCVEISRLMMLNPDMKTGAFFTTMSNSQRDINKSDATIVMSAAILKHIGNDKMSERILSKSKTCEKLFDEFGFKNTRLCEMFVVMLFSLNPTFCTMLNTSMHIALTRAAEFLKEENDQNKLIDASKTLAADGSWTKEEALNIIVPNAQKVKAIMAHENSFEKTPTEMIHPNESISEVGRVPSYRERINTKDLMSYVTRRKRGREPNFTDVYRSEDIPRPPVASVKTNKYGLGYAPTEADRARDSMNHRINQAMGGLSTRSININTGRERFREPRVSDFLDSESIAESALKSPQSVTESSWLPNNFKAPRPPTPTEYSLKDTDYNTTTDRTVRNATSFELLMDNLKI